MTDMLNTERTRALDLAALLDLCVRRGATDLHLADGQPPALRVDGELEREEGCAPLGADELSAIAQELFTHSGDANFDRTGSQDGALTSAGGARFRFNVYRRMGGLAVALRLLDEEIKPLAELGLPDSLYELCGASDGLVILAGPTGAGKSTTLAALVDRVNRTRRGHVITIEDPIEYVHEQHRCLVNQRQVGSDAPDFHQALVAALREDPDVILLGEARDLDTMRTALRAAETGHLVFTTVHASDSVSAVERVVSMFPADEQAGVRRQFALVLRAILAQRLLPADGPRRTATDCAELPRRVVASEYLVGTTAVANLVATGRSAQLVAAMEGGGGDGMYTLEADLARLVADGRISAAAAHAHARSAEEVDARVASRRNAVAKGLPSVAKGLHSVAKGPHVDARWSR